MDLYSRRIKIVLGLVVSMTTVGWIVLVLPPGGQSAYTPDSIYYLLVSKSIAAGHGITLFNYSLFDPHFVPYTMWPPLYPVLLSSTLSPLFIQAGLLACLAAFSYVLFTDLARIHWLAALVLSVVVVLPWPMLMDASYVWSELFALFWVFVAMTALGRIGESLGKRPVAYWLLAVVALSLAVYTRYAALVFLPGLMLAMLRAPLEWRYRWAMSVATPFVGGVLLAPLLLRNLMMSGHLSGAARAVSKLSSEDLWSSVFLYVGWIFGNDKWERAVFVISLLALVLALVVYRLDRRRLTEVVTDQNDGAPWLAWIASSFAVAYVVGIVLLRAWKNFDLSVRMVSPVAPFLLLALVSWAVVVWRGVPVIWQRVVLVLPFMVLLSLSAFTSWQMGSQAWHNWKVTGSPQWHMNSLFVYSNLRPVASPKLDGIVLNSRPAIMAFRTGWDFRRAPKGPWSQGDLERIAATATGVMIDSRMDEQLARALQRVVSKPRLVRIGGVAMFLWGNPQPALGE